MEALASAQVAKVFIMLALLLVFFFIVAYLFKKNFYSRMHKNNISIIDSVYFNSKDRVLNFQYKQSTYLIYIGQSGCILLDKGEFDEADLSEQKVNGLSFKKVMESIYKK